VPLCGRVQKINEFPEPLSRYGSSDGKYVVIREGLQEGRRVVLGTGA